MFLHDISRLSLRLPFHCIELVPGLILEGLCFRTISSMPSSKLKSNDFKPRIRLSFVLRTVTSFSWNATSDSIVNVQFSCWTFQAQRTVTSIQRFHYCELFSYHNLWTICRHEAPKPRRVKGKTIGSQCKYIQCCFGILFIFISESLVV